MKMDHIKRAIMIDAGTVTPDVSAAIDSCRLTILQL